MGNKIRISNHFDSGNIKVIEADTPTAIKLEINKDSNSDFYQWFHFKLQSRRGVEHIIHITNALNAVYAEGWENYQALASYDRKVWFRVNTQYKEGELIIKHTPEQSSVFYAYFTPYSYEQHQDLLHRIQSSKLCNLQHLGETIDGRDMTLAVIGDEGKNNKPVWIIGRQHPGESMAEWFIEGVIDRLLDEDDAVATKLLQTCTFYIIPNMNPDGCVRGNLRTNALGSNLNREWMAPTLEKSPEVYWVRKKMMETSVSLFLDIHGDEAIPYNFLSGCEGIPSYDERHQSMEEGFKSAFLKASPDFQVKHGYPEDDPGQANLTMASTWVGEQYKCLSYTLEMPFKDNDDFPDPISGWSAERSYLLGDSVLVPILETITHF